MEHASTAHKKKKWNTRPLHEAKKKANPNAQFTKKRFQKNVRQNKPPPLDCRTHVPRAEKRTCSMHHDDERMIHEKDPLLCP